MKLAAVPFVAISAAILVASVFAADAPPTSKPASKPALKITPGKVIVPFDTMRRPWGELISIDLQTRTGKFRNETTDEVMSFTIMPYAEMLHHATFGDASDFKVGERVIFRLHPNEAGEWVWLTYIQDEMNMLNGHKEYFFVDSIDAGKKQVITTQAKLDKSFIREKDIAILTDAETRFWKAGQPAKFEDIKIGDAIRTKTHGVGKGKVRVAWEVFLDDESLLMFQERQKAVHAERMAKQGACGYADDAVPATDSTSVRQQFTFFQESLDYLTPVKPAAQVQIAPAGVDRNPTAPAITASVVTIKKVGKTTQVVLDLPPDAKAFETTSLVRMWIAAK